MNHIRVAAIVMIFFIIAASQACGGKQSIAATPTPRVSPTPSKTYTFHEGFDNGFDKTKWIGSGQTNYRDDKITVDNVRSHDGRYSAHGLVGTDNQYARAARNIPYGGHGFELTAWFYIDLKEFPYKDSFASKKAGKPVYKGTSEWVGVVNVTADPKNRGLIDNNILNYRVVGFNNRTNYNMLAYHYWQYPLDGIIRATESGWYKGRITYNNVSFTFEMFNAKGVKIGPTRTVTNPGYVPRAIIMNAGSQYHRIDDITYRTW